MVKVISAYNFQEQNTYSINGDIVDTCLIGNDRLAIAQKNHLIDILCLKHKNTSISFQSTSSPSDNIENINNVFQNDQNKNSPPTKTMFPTVDQVQKLFYCKSGHYLLTLECKTDTHDELKKRFVRAYVNFDIAEIDNCFSTPIRARIASKVTPKTDSSNCIEVIEIPFNENPDIIACCQSSGTILISSNKKLHFYEFQNRSNLSQKFTFIDFFEVPFYIELEFIPKKIKITENIIACMNETTMCVFKIIDLIEINTEDGSTSNSLTTGSSANIFNQTTNIPIDFEVAKQCNQINGVELQLKVHSNWDSTNDSHNSKTNFSEEKPIPVNDIKIQLKYYDEYTHEHDGIFYSVKPLLQLRQPSSDRIVGQIHDEFRSIALKPIYCKYQQQQKQQQQPQQQQKSNEIKKNQNLHALKSSNYTNCIGFSFFVSTVSDGYLYQFTNQEKWYIENTKCLATYPFTAPVLDVIIDNYVIHAITECGIETFSSRVGHKLFSSYFEYPMLSAPYPNEIGPILDVPICVMGICGFFGIKFVVNSDTNLVLLSTCETDDKIPMKLSTNTATSTTTSTTTSATTINKKSNLNRNKSNEDTFNEWTLYNLQLPKPEQLINDIKNLANIYKSSCPDVYYELMEEAFVIIRLARIHNNDKNDNLEKIFIEICQLLAEYTLLSDRKEIYSQSVAYYSMCKYPVWEIYKFYIINMQKLNEQQQKNKNYNNLIYTLKILLTSLKSNKIDGEYLTQNVKPLLNTINNNNKIIKSSLKNEYNVAEEFLEFFKIYAPNEIAPICLISSVFREIINDSLIELFSKTTRKLKSDEQLCYILCLFKNNQINKSIEILDKMKPKELLNTLKKHWIIIFDNFNIDNYRLSTFSDFTEIILFSTNKSKIIEVIADVFIHLLIITHYIDLDFILNRFMNYFAINLGKSGYRQSQQILEILLQSYFYDLYYLNTRNITIDAGNICINNKYSITSEQLITNNITTAATAGTESHNSLSLCLMNSLSPNDQYQQHSNNSIKNDFIMAQPPTAAAATTTTATNNHISDYNYEDAEQEAMKILFRMYLGWLKQYSTTKQQQNNQGNIKKNNTRKNSLNSSSSSASSTSSASLPSTTATSSTLDDQIFGYRLAFIEFMFHNSKIIKRMHAKFDKQYSSDLSYGSDQMISLYDDSACIQTSDDEDDNDDVFEDNNGKSNNSSRRSSNDTTGQNMDDDKSKILFRRRPILFFERRETFLNKMPPFNEESFKIDENNGGTLYFNDWDKDVNVILIKIQALLNSGKLNGNLIDDFISFIQSNPNVIGIDSLIAILLPKSEGEEFLIHVMPKNLLHYAKSRLTTVQQWQTLIQRILNRRRGIPDSEIELMKFYDQITFEILEHLANTKTLEEFLSCIPEKELQKYPNDYHLNDSTKQNNVDHDDDEEYHKEKQQEQELHEYHHKNDDGSIKIIKLRKHSYDGIDETDPFQLIMRSVVAKQRSDALCAMIQSTGRQLYEAMNNSQLHLN